MPPPRLAAAQADLAIIAEEANNSDDAKSVQDRYNDSLDLGDSSSQGASEENKSAVSAALSV